MSERLEQLAAEVVLDQDRELAQRDDLHRVRTKLLAPARRRLPIARIASAVVVLAVAAGLLFALVPSSAEPMGYRIEGERELASVDRFLSTSADRSIALRFTDGSQVRLRAETAARVTRVADAS